MKRLTSLAIDSELSSAFCDVQRVIVMCLPIAYEYLALDITCQTIE